MSRTMKTLCLLLVLAALMGSYALIGQINEKKAKVEEEAGRFVLADHTAVDVAALEWTFDGETMRFERQDGSWVSAHDAGIPIDQDAAEALAEAVAELEAVRKLENVENTGDYGLETPAFTVNVEWSDDAATAYGMGDETPFGDGWYMSLSSESGVVYAVEEDLSATFDLSLIDLVMPEDIPHVEEPVALTIGDMRLVRKDESITLDPEQLWYTDDDMPVNADDVQAMIDLCAGMEWDDMVAASATGAELTGWNLTGDAAMQVILEGADGSSLTLMIGGTDDEGDYYVRLKDSDMVYTVASGDISGLADADVSDMYVTDPIPLAWEHLASVSFTVGDAAWDIVRTEDSEDAEADATVTVNGEPADAASAETIWALIDGLVCEEAEEAEGEEILTFTFENESGRTASYAIRAYDVDSYLMTGPVGSYTVSAETIDKVVRSLKQF